jgi:hypothetical protein
LSQLRGLPAFAEMVPMRPKASRECKALRPTIRRGLAALGLALLAFTLIAGAARAQSEESLYTVAKLPVDVTSKNAVEAKSKALAEAQQRAFRTVLRRVAPFGASAQLEVGPQELEALIGGLSVRNEKYSTTRYIASLDISFNEQAVRELLSGRGIPINDRRAPSIAILPVSIEGEKVSGSGSRWYQAWMDLDLTHGLVSATIVQPREGFDARLVNAVLSGDTSAYEEIKGAYSGQPVVVAVGQPQGGAFTIRLAGEDGVGQLNFGQNLRLGGNEAAGARNAAAFALAVLENRWKAKEGEALGIAAPGPEGAEGGVSPLDPGGSQGEPERNVVALVEFSGLRQWQEMRSRLTYVPGLQGLEVNSLSARSASITFGYAGSLGHLQKVLAENGFSFENAEDNFIIRAR